MAKKETKAKAKKETKAKAAKQEILGPTYEPGLPQGIPNWRTKMGDRAQMLKYLETGERYWYAKEGFGSEKRSKPA